MESHKRPVPNEVTSYVCELTAEEGERLKEYLADKGWVFSEMNYAHWKAKKEKTNIVFYKSGKFTVQGKGTGDFVTFILEPEILKTASFGYEHLSDNMEEAKPFVPHAGIDESGKGDFFGPLCVCAAYVDLAQLEKLRAVGVQDSKNIKSDRKISAIAQEIKKILRGKYAIITIGNEAYNRMYDNIGNLNKMLAWGHARALENLLEKVPECTEVLADKFGNEKLIKNALMEKGKKVILTQETKAESDIAVAAASILARDRFVSALEELGTQYGVTLPKGAGPKVLETGRALYQQVGEEGLAKISKVHFKTFEKVRSEAL